MTSDPRQAAHDGDEPLAPERLARLERALGALGRERAPAELRARVELELSTHLPISALVRSLGAQRAPHVLHRLVREEAAKPHAPIERFTRSLPKLRAPRGPLVLLDADGSSTGLLTPVRRIRMYRFASAAALVVAAVILAWSLRDDAPDAPTQRPDRPPLRFEVRVASSIEDLHPMTRSLAYGFVPEGVFGGGAR